MKWFKESGEITKKKSLNNNITFTTTKEELLEENRELRYSNRLSYEKENPHDLKNIFKK